MALLRPLMNRPIKNIKDLLQRIKEVERLDHEVTVYPDAEEYINRALYLERIRDRVADIRKDPKNHPLRKGLLKTELLPYQLDGIAFSVGMGRAVLADDMGLGKTIQGVGVAELLSQEAGISKVLVICPASVKSQWRLEIMRFSNRSHQIVLGSASERAAQYDAPCFFTICNYEQVLRDLLPIERVKWDLIILDEGQRQLLGAAFAFIGEMLPKKEGTEETFQMAESLKSHLSDCLERDDKGRLKMTIILPDESVLNNLAKSLAQILGSSGWKP